MEADLGVTIWYWKGMGKMYEETIDGIRVAIRDRFGSARKLAEKADVSPHLITRWLAGTRAPAFDKLSQVLEALGARILFDSGNIQGFAPSKFDKELAATISDMLKARRIALEDAALCLFPNSPERNVMMKRILEAREPITPSTLLTLSELLRDEPGNLLRTAAKQTSKEQDTKSRKSA